MFNTFAFRLHSAVYLHSVGLIGWRTRTLQKSRTWLRQGCPIYGKIRFLRIFIACLSLRKKNDFWPNLRIFSNSVRLLTPPPPHCTRDRGILRKKTIFGRIYGFFLLNSGNYPPPPPDFRLAVFRARRMNLFGCAEWTFFGYYPKSQDFSQFRLGNPAEARIPVVWAYNAGSNAFWRP